MASSYLNYNVSYVYIMLKDYFSSFVAIVCTNTGCTTSKTYGPYKTALGNEHPVDYCLQVFFIKCNFLEFKIILVLVRTRTL